MLTPLCTFTNARRARMQTGLQLPQCKKTAHQWQLKHEVWQIALACDVYIGTKCCVAYTAIARTAVDLRSSVEIGFHGACF